MREFRQARWDEPLIFELGGKGRRGVEFTRLFSDDPLKTIPENMRRTRPPDLPELSEVEVIRHYIRLSQMNYSVDLGIYPLGSCTMKYNPKICEEVARSPKVELLHPNQDESTVQGILEIMYKLSRWLAEITGMYEVSLAPFAGAHGEFLGVLIMRAYHKHEGNLSERTEIIVPDSAHGTNPASAAQGGFKVVVVPSDDSGCVDIEALKAATSRRTAGLMLTNPNTLGIFEKNIKEIAEIIHDAGGLLYYDGANLNAILGKVRPGDMGFDIVHLNLHKTFGTPHGGGGPGSGPVGVVETLEKFLPVPRIVCEGGRYRFDYDRPYSVGRIGGFYGNVPALLKTFVYIMSLGREGLEEVAETSVLNANYLAKKLKEVRGFQLPFDGKSPRKHECVLSLKRLRDETGVKALDFSKRILDFGLHPPTIYFPLIVDEALMVEPTESFEKEELDRLIETFKAVSEEAYRNPNLLLEAPHNTSVGRVDEVRASHPRTLTLSWRMYRKDKNTLVDR